MSHVAISLTVLLVLYKSQQRMMIFFFLSNFLQPVPSGEFSLAAKNLEFLWGNLFEKFQVFGDSCPLHCVTGLQILVFFSQMCVIFIYIEILRTILKNILFILHIKTKKCRRNLVTVLHEYLH